jgi:colanic acid/amylovoran biosynthesis protein
MSKVNERKVKEQKPIVIGLLWHSVSSDNLGVGALTESQIAICEDAAKQADCKVEYLIFGTQGGCNYVPNTVTVKVGSRVSIKKILLGESQFLKELETCDLVLDIGEGDSFTDIYGLKRYLFLMVSKLAVLLKRKPLILSPQTIGPFDYWLTRLLAAMLMRRCKRVYARDGLSFNYLKQCGVNANVDEVIDVAFKLPFTLFKHEAENNRVKIGLNVSGLLFSGGYTQNNQFGLTINYSDLIRKLITDWSKNDAYEVWLIPHVIPDTLPVEDDRKAIATLAIEFPTLKVAPTFNSPSEAKSFIASMDFMTGARMHACIAAFSSGVPVVPLAYSRKFNGLFSSLGYHWVADGKAMSTTEAIDIIQLGLEKREELKQEVKHGNLIASKLLTDYQAYLTECIKSI